MDTIRHSGEHLLALINDILDLSKIEARKLDLYPGPIYLPGFLNTIVQIIRDRAEGKGLRLLFEASDNLPVGVQAFQPFEQVGDLSRRSGGTGLGLAISRQLGKLLGKQVLPIK